MYVPLARKYRPSRFSEVVGQEVPVRVLKNAVKEGRVANAYLFAGPRGVGKTTLARVFTKALNCLNPEEGEPCGECENCKEIERGSFPDLVEIDAASNRGIDDIRALKENVSYAPLKGEYKVYIIDEAHMLTREAFNALLKTLEEPPPRTVFILCTTEHERIPPTIVSRCQRLLFRRVQEDLIVDHLKNVCSKEGIEAEERALKTVARVSEGCLRDALSLLDQVSVFSEGKVTSQAVEEVLGIVGEEKIFEFMEKLFRGDVEGCIAFLRDIYFKGYNLMRFWESLESELSNLALYKALKDPAKVIEVKEHYKRFQDIPLERILYLETLVNRGKVDARTRDSLKAFELAIVKSSLVGEVLSLGEVVKRIQNATQQVNDREGEKEVKKNLTADTTKLF